MSNPPPIQDAFRLAIESYHTFHQRFTVLLIQPGLLVGYMMADGYGLLHLHPMGAILGSPLAAFGGLWLGVMGLAAAEGVGWGRRLWGWAMAVGATILLYVSLILTVQVLLPDPGYKSELLAVGALVAAGLMVVFSVGWARVSLGLGWAWALLMGFHPLFHMVLVAVSAVILRTLL